MQRSIILVFLIWLVTLAVGFSLVENYRARPSSTALTNCQWISASGKVPNWTGKDGSPNPAHCKQLWMFIHPMCPCTLASIDELEKVVARTSDQMETTIYIWLPWNAPPDWPDSSLVRSARSIPNVRIELDIDGAIAKSHSASTSGHVLLFDCDGSLLFNGGITSQRGHAGDNYGSASILAFLRGEPSFTHSTPVFGCSLGVCVGDDQP